MDIKQDPNSIPNFGGGGRIGELQADEPEVVQSSVELDPVDGSESDVTPATTEQDHGAAAAAPTLAEAGGLPVDKSKTGEGAIDALVGAP